MVHQYVYFNAWANAKTVGWLKTLDKELLHKETPSSFDTLDKTLQHIVQAQVFWLAFVRGESLTGFKWAVEPGDPAVVFEALLSSSRAWADYVAPLDAAALAERLTLDMPWAQNQLSRYEYIVHAVNHGTYHRGQLVTMARTLGIVKGIPNMDYNMFRSNP